MVEAKSQEVRQWMQKAEHDLLAAAHVLGLDEPLTDIAVYHCQQAAEKALKAFLVEHDAPFGKTHDLDELVAQCATIAADFSRLSEAAAILTPFAVAFRYPTGQPDPPVSEAWEAVEMARTVVSIVVARLVSAAD